MTIKPQPGLMLKPKSPLSRVSNGTAPSTTTRAKSVIKLSRGLLTALPNEASERAKWDFLS